jgi:hypothetical protein
MSIGGRRRALGGQKKISMVNAEGWHEEAVNWGWAWDVEEQTGLKF